MNPDTPIVEIVVGLVVSGVVGALSFMLKRSFADVTDGLKSLTAKVDGFAATQAAHGTAMALHEQWRETAKEEITELRRVKHELVSSVTALRGELVFMRETVEALQHQVAEVRGDSGAHPLPRRSRDG